VTGRVEGDLDLVGGAGPGRHRLLNDVAGLHPQEGPTLVARDRRIP
jgi:hypothetical protein